MRSSNYINADIWLRTLDFIIYTSYNIIVIYLTYFIKVITIFMFYLIYYMQKSNYRLQ